MRIWVRKVPLLIKVKEIRFQIKTLSLVCWSTDQIKWFMVNKLVVENYFEMYILNDGRTNYWDVVVTVLRDEKSEIS